MRKSFISDSDWCVHGLLLDADQQTKSASAGNCGNGPGYRRQWSTNMYVGFSYMERKNEDNYNFLAECKLGKQTKTRRSHRKKFEVRKCQHPYGGLTNNKLDWTATSSETSFCWDDAFVCRSDLRHLILYRNSHFSKYCVATDHFINLVICLHTDASHQLQAWQERREG